MPLKEITWLFRLSFDAHTSARRGNSSARFDSCGFEILFRPRHWPGPCRSHRRAVALKKIFSLFFSAGDGKSIVENFPSLRTPANSKRDRRGCDGQASVTLGALLPFLSSPSSFKVPFMLWGPLSWRKWSPTGSRKLATRPLQETRVVQKTTAELHSRYSCWRRSRRRLGGEDGFPRVSLNYIAGMI